MDHIVAMRPRNFAKYLISSPAVGPWLERGLKQNETGLSIAAFHYSFLKLHNDERWQPFLAKIGKSDAQLANIEFNVTPPR